MINVSSTAQNIRVSGTILDADNSPLSGVNVVQQGTTNGTITDIDGKYEIGVPPNAVLIFSYIGYPSITEPVNGRTTLPSLTMSSLYSRGSVGNRSRFWWTCGGVSVDPTQDLHLFFTEVLIDALELTLDLIDSDIFNGSDEEISLSYLPAHYLSIKDNGTEIYENRKLKFGEFCKNTYIYANFGWKWAYTGLCPYVSLKFRWQNFDTKFLADEESKQNKIRTFIPGVGVRMPFANLKRKWGWSPVIEIGSEYNIITKYKKGIFGTDKNQLNNKTLTTTYGLGFEFWRFAVVGTLSSNSNELYNRDYSPDNGFSYPFKNITTNDMSFRIDLSYYLGRNKR